jgi:hypothetical protein
VKWLTCILVLLFAAPTWACPEVVVPVDPRDGALRSNAWKQSLKHFRSNRYKRALKAFTKTAARLQKDAERLFQPKVGKEGTNSEIQKWLQRHVYRKNAGVIIQGEKFTFPALVWWAWADSACRTGAYAEAARALSEVRALQRSPELLYHEAIVGLRMGQLAPAKRMLRLAPPHSFITPYVQGMIARSQGRIAVAGQRLKQAQRGAMLEDQQRAVKRALRELPGE